ncbi:MAG: hypothetical protein ACPGU1_04780 [Myxococcota bacterium]
MLVVLLGACGGVSQDSEAADAVGASIADSGTPAGRELSSPTEALTPVQTAECLSDGDCGASEPPSCHSFVCVNQLCVLTVSDDQTPCEDGNPCTLDTFCIEGACGGGRATTCNDGNPCTMDACDPITGCSHTPSPSGGACDDNDPCSLDDACFEGVCTGDLAPECVCEDDTDCTEHEDDNLCNGSLSCIEGGCRLNPSTVVTCPPSEGCLLTVCQPSTGACATQDAPNGTGCDDGNPCTTDDRCSEGACEGSAGACPCEVDDDCAVLQTESYNLCQGPLHCSQDRVCTPDPSHAVTCPADDDPTDCVDVACSPGTGMCATFFVQDGAECEGDNPCSPLGVCQTGLCVAPDALCDDDNPCTEDTCAGDAGCVYTPLTGVPCADDDACTGDDMCTEGLCVSGPAIVCDDNNPCTLDKCVSAAGGCTAEPLEDGLTCQPNNLCLLPGECALGSCIGGAAVVCDDASPCTMIQCLPAHGCVEEPATDGSMCEDENPCTQTGTCEAGSCSTVPMACNDDNPCTMDSCQEGACTHTALADGSGCDTGNACDQEATCESGVCQGAVAVICEPGLCDVKSCDPATGACVVTHTSPDDTNCGGGDACQLPGVCEDGTCEGMADVSCDDSDACTVDACQSEFGLCKHTETLCPPDAQSPCAVAGCDSTAGCTLIEDDNCHDASLLWFNDFSCSDDGVWDWGASLGHPLFELTSTAPTAGALAEGCQAHISIPATAIASDTPWTSSLVSEAFALPPDYAGPLSVRFWHALEWEGSSVNDDIERRLQLLDANSQVIESQPLTYSDTAWGAWVQEEVTFDLVSGEATHIALTLTSKPTDATLSCSWTIDHVVVFAPLIGAP